MRITTQSQITIKPQLADFLSNVKVGDTVKGKLVEMLGDSISIKTASGQIFTAALMKAAEMKSGQTIELIINSITSEGIFAELKTENPKQSISDDAKLQQLLKQMDLKPEASNMQAAKLLLKYSMPVTKENINNLVITHKSMESLAQKDVSTAISLMQSELDINNTEVVKLAKLSAAIEPQSIQIVKALSVNSDDNGAEIEPNKVNNSNQNEKPNKTTDLDQNTIKYVEGTKTSVSNPKAVMQQLANQLEALPKVELPKLEKLMDNITKVFDAVSQAKPEQTAYMMAKEIKITPAAVKLFADSTLGENKISKQLEGMGKLIEKIENEQVDVKELKQELKKLFIKPEILQDKEKITENFKDIVKLGSKLETVLKEQGLENKLDTSALQDIKNNMDFLKVINSNINYIQVPMMVNDSKTTAEIYVYRDNKRSKSINPENATILIALDLNRIGHMESLISVVKKNVDITFRFEKEKMRSVVASLNEDLRQALAARGYNLINLNTIDIKEKFNILEQEMLSENVLGHMHMDIKV